MIKYCLICKNCTTEFESWFSSSKEFDRLKKLKHLKCQNCNSIKIEKSFVFSNLIDIPESKHSKMNLLYPLGPVMQLYFVEFMRQVKK